MPCSNLHSHGLTLCPYTTLFRSRILIRVEPIYSAEENVVGVIYLEASLEGVYTQQAEINEIFLKGSMIAIIVRSEEHTSELQSRGNLVCRLQLEKNNNQSICMYV